MYFTFLRKRSNLRKFGVGMMLTSVAYIAAGAAHAQTAPYPNRTVRVIVASVPGGSLDISARPVFQKMQERLGTPFIIENRGGGTVALDNLARSAPDGYTLLVGTNSNFFAAEQVAKVPYDVRTKIIPVGQLVNSAFLMMVNVDLPVKNLGELINYAKANPTVLNYAYVAGGSAAQLAGELMKMRAGINMQGIGFKGAAPAYVEQMAGRIHVTFGTIVSGIGLVKGGKLRAIAVTSANRFATLPDIPTIRETLPTFDVFDAWVGVFTVEGTPAPLVNTLNRGINQVLALPEIKKLLTTEGSEPNPGTPAELRQALITGLDSSRRIVRDAKLEF